MESVSCDLQCKMQPHNSDFLNKFSELYHTKLSIAYVHPSPKRCVRDTMSRNPARSDTDKIDDNLVQMLFVFGALVPNQPTNSTCAPSASRLCSFFGPAQQIAHNISSWPLRVDRSGQLEHRNESAFCSTVYICEVSGRHKEKGGWSRNRLRYYSRTVIIHSILKMIH